MSIFAGTVLWDQNQEYFLPENVNQNLIFRDKVTEFFYPGTFSKISYQGIS